MDGGNCWCLPSQRVGRKSSLTNRDREQGEGVPCYLGATARLALETNVCSLRAWKQVNSLIFETIYERGGNVSHLETLVSIAEEAGLPGAATRRYLTSREGVETVINEDLHAKNVLNIMSAPQYVLRGASPMSGSISVPGNSGRAIVLQGAVSSLNIVQALWSAPSR